MGLYKLPIDLPCTSINTLEKAKFQEDGNGDICIRTCGETSITGSRALSVDYNEITVNDITWTDITSFFTDILVLSVQNNSGTEIKLYNATDAATPAGYFGMPLKTGRERNYNDLDTGFTIWAKALPASGSVVLDVEVLKNA